MASTAPSSAWSGDASPRTTTNGLIGCGWSVMAGRTERALGSGMMTKLDHGPACHRKTVGVVQGNGTGYQFSRRMTAFGATPAAAKMSDRADVSGLLRAPSS